MFFSQFFICYKPQYHLSSHIRFSTSSNGPHAARLGTWVEWNVAWFSILVQSGSLPCILLPPAYMQRNCLCQELASTSGEPRKSLNCLGVSVSPLWGLGGETRRYSCVYAQKGGWNRMGLEMHLWVETNLVQKWAIEGGRQEDSGGRFVVFPSLCGLLCSKLKLVQIF